MTYARNKANTLQVVYGADTFYEVSRLEAANDRFDGTPEERFEYMRRVLAKKWVESLQAPWLVNDWENK